MIRPIGLRPDTLPAHPQRQPDELLSSWIVALARSNGAKVHTLCSRYGGHQHTVWNRDVDRMSPPALLKQLSEWTAIDVDTIRTFTLAYLAEQIDPNHHPNGWATWLLPLGVWHRTRKGYGVQFCPLCLRMDARPYVRRSWRLAYYTECEHHHLLMLDRCPQCSSAFNYFRGELGSRSRVDAPGMNVCTTCDFDLGYAMPDRFEWPDWRLAVATRTLLLMNDSGWAVLGDRTFAPAYELLRVARQLIQVMSSSRRAGQLYDSVALNIWPEGYGVLSERGLAFERRSVSERHRLFGMAIWLLSDWPVRFERVVRHSGIHRNSLTRDMSFIPLWYLDQCSFTKARRSSACHR